MDRFAGLLLVASAIGAGWFHWRYRAHFGGALFAALAGFAVQLGVALGVVAVVYGFINGEAFSGPTLPAFIKEHFAKGVFVAVFLFWSWGHLKTVG